MFASLTLKQKILATVILAVALSCLLVGYFSQRSAQQLIETRMFEQELPNLTKNPGDGIGFAAWPAYRVSQGAMWSMQFRLNDCFRQQRFPYPGFASDLTVALGVYMGVNAKGAESIAPAIKR